MPIGLPEIKKYDLLDIGTHKFINEHTVRNLENKQTEVLNPMDIGHSHSRSVVGFIKAVVKRRIQV